MKPELRSADADALGALASDLHRKASLGQYMTPQSISDFMASLFPKSALDPSRLLDASAGRGALSCAFLECWERRDGLTFNAVDLEAFELDQRMRSAQPKGTKQMRVRANAQLDLESVEDPLPYQAFFQSLEKGMFLTAHLDD